MKFAMLHYKRCDKYPDCPAINACPKKAINLADDEHFCVDIDLCSTLPECEVCYDKCKLFRIIKSQDAKRVFEQEVYNDTITPNELFQERFSADSFSQRTVIRPNQITEHLSQQSGFNIVEVIDKNLALCLYQSVPVQEIIGSTPYVKVVLADDSEKETMMRVFSLDRLPAILIFYGSNLVSPPIVGRFVCGGELSGKEQRDVLSRLIGKIILGGETNQCVRS